MKMIEKFVKRWKSCGYWSGLERSENLEGLLFIGMKIIHMILFKMKSIYGNVNSIYCHVDIAKEVIKMSITEVTSIYQSERIRESVWAI